MRSGGVLFCDTHMTHLECNELFGMCCGVVGILFTDENATSRKCRESQGVVSILLVLCSGLA